MGRNLFGYDWGIARSEQGFEPAMPLDLARKCRISSNFRLYLCLFSTRQFAISEGGNHFR
ncbi:hypothetical protein B5J99_01215 [Blastomonas fulva]|uniref:Uncharacterized protein n=1 Tax=Blastomonas fulva TaxID=1550728 RepID=A0ABM6M368_9SPHN|nr:hypothetical protein B5J99_01215 [Blastomonas fulva]